MLCRAVKQAKAPVFLIQTQNDRSLGPIELLSKELEKQKNVNRSKIYPAFGKTAKDAKGFGTDGWEIWGYDVLTFLEEMLKK